MQSGDMNMAKRPVRTECKESHKKVCDAMYLSSRYLANIENNGQHPSLQIFFELMQRGVSMVWALTGRE